MEGKRCTDCQIKSINDLIVPTRRRHEYLDTMREEVFGRASVCHAIPRPALMGGGLMMVINDDEVLQFVHNV